MEAVNPKKMIDPLAFVKLASLFVVDGVLLTRDHNTKINAEHFDWVEDFENIQKYPWALESYNLMVSNLKSLMRGQPEKFEAALAKNLGYKNAKFMVWSLPHVLQVWAYEKISGLAGKCGEKVKSEQASILNWKAIGFFHYSSLKELVFTDEPLEETDDEKDGEEDDEEEDGEEEGDGEEGDGQEVEDVKLFRKLKVLEELLKTRDEIEQLRSSVRGIEATLGEVKDMLSKVTGVVLHGKKEVPTEEKEVPTVEEKPDSVQDNQRTEHDMPEVDIEQKWFTS
ncbi:unnamed protein product [Cuscuta europaea]|uniref:DUF1985 domain-containing protein n=1 Tax=Cuscuta europaea TaxID=41803 RepID=A0A9P1E0M1_CUSEU|nr:unnamed protein product [Cuscuta europaea]